MTVARLFGVFVLLLLAMPAALAASPQELDLPETAAAAEGLERRLQANLAFAVAAGAPQPDSRDAVLQELAPEAAPQVRAAALERLAGAGLAQAEDWLNLAALYLERRQLQDAQAAAWLAATRSREPHLVGDALALLARALEMAQGSAVASDWLSARPEALVVGAAATLRAELAERATTRFQQVQVDLDRPRPQACLAFTGPLSQRQPLPLSDYLRIAPRVQLDVHLEGGRLCLTGLQHGTSYEIELRPGLQSARGERLAGQEGLQAVIGDRTPSVGFQTGAYVLPADDDPLVPVTTVNARSLDLALYRVGARNLLSQLEYGDLGRQLNGYDLDRLAQTEGERLWQGGMEVPPAAANRDSTSLVPLDDLLPARAPGVYILTATVADPGRTPEPWEQVATQWLVVTDLGLNLFEGRDGLTVFARSFGDARPLAGAELSLIARNNEVLGGATTGPDGQARFAPGLLQGEGGNRPAALYARTEAGDFAFIDLQGPALDLSERGVAGRPAPGPIEAFVTPERGIYRPGETVHLTALLRRDTGVGLPDAPATLSLVRPDGVEAFRATSRGDGLGGHVFSVGVAKAVPTGLWRALVYLDPAAAPVGEAAFVVEDFVPRRLELDLNLDREVLGPGETAEVELAGRWLFGAPAAGLPVRGEAVIAPDPQPFPGYAAWTFGLAGEEVAPLRERLPAARTDAAGAATLPVALPRVPDAASPLAATLSVGLLDAGGRAVTETLKLPLRPRGAEIGLKPRFAGGSVPAGAVAAVDLVALDPAGEPLPGREVTAEWIEVRTDWIPYWQGGTRWRKIETEIPIARETVVTGADGQALLERPLDWGDYALRVLDAEGAATSVAVRAGWRAASGETDVPDALEVTPAESDLRPGEILQAFVKAPFAGRALVTVLRDGIMASFEVDLPAEGTTVEIPVEAGWSPGVYLAVSAYRPRRPDAEGPPSERAPARAMGAAWVTVDKPARSLEVRLDPPAEMRPRQELIVPVAVSGQGDRPVRLVVAAVDEGVLQVTDFATPDPLAFLFAQRRLGLDLRDLYGKLIDPADGARGQVRSGGGMPLNLGGLTRRTTEVVSLFSGPVDLGPDGTAEVTLRVPDFNGRLRVMALAWSLGGMGSASAAVTVRDPLVADLVLPRFLAVGDRAEATLELHNLAGGAGDYRVEVSVGQAVALQSGTTVRLESGGRTALPVPLEALQPGTARVQLVVSGPDGFELERGWDLPVRAPQPYVTRRSGGALGAGQTRVLGRELVEGFLPGTLDVALVVADRPDLGGAGLLQSLLRYPYGCVEQTISRALPLVYLPGLALDRQVALDWSDERVEAAVAEAVGSVLARQTAAGGFGLWQAAGEDLWISAYAADFLSRAQAEGFDVPSGALERAYAYLSGQAGSTWSEDLAGRAYAYLVLARAGRAELGDLRYFAETQAASLPTPAARLQLAAALAAVGERARAAVLFRLAEADWDRDAEGLVGWDYGSPLRDAAMGAALAAEGGFADLAWDAATRAGQSLALRERLSTQEELWLLLADRALTPEDAGQAAAPLPLAVAGQAVQAEGRLVLQPTPDELAEGVALRHTGDGRDLRLSVTLVGVPSAPLPPAERGLTVARRILGLDGAALDLTAVRQNDQAVVVLAGRVTDGQPHQALVVDLLPAGFEIESVLAGGGATDALAFLPELSRPLYEARRDDRYVAALDLPANGRFVVAYVVRAVTPGDFVLPAPFVEDMYRPEAYARGAMGGLSVSRLQ